MASSSSRLRSRLGREEIDPVRSSKLTENFVLIGTPLPPLDQRDSNEGKPIWEQEVRDEQGRRRFHGAFTGGWSAGYYNTVGSKEGWTPSTFVSSRTARPGGKAQMRPEDFMDEEDLAEIDSSRKLSQREDYSNEARLDTRHGDDKVLGDLLGLGKAARQHLESGTDIPSDTGLVAPKTSLGHRILVRMGWKLGGGLGKPMMAGQPTKDTPMPPVVQGVNKKDTHGLGWAGEVPASPTGTPQTLQAALQVARLEVEPNPPGFGISVMEEADDDDVSDVYASTESIRDVMRRRQEEQARRLTLLQKAQSRPEATVPRPGSGMARKTWRDGRLLPEGFVIENESMIDDAREQTQVNWFAPPSVPPGWKPDPLQVWRQAKGSAGPPSSVASSSAAPLKQPADHPLHQMKAANRGQLLGEARIPGPPPSLSSYLPDGHLPLSSAATPRSTVNIPRIEAPTARAALKGFLPFGNDPEKQMRYVSYLEVQTNSTSSNDATMLIPTGRSASDLVQELEEFARSASIFKPLSTAMASRFASASTEEGGGDAHVPKGGLYQPELKSRETLEEESKRKAKQEEERLEREKEERMNDRQRAARAQMFGHLTRQVKAWYPPRLLCKRFGVPDPHPDRSGAHSEGDDAGRDSGTSPGQGGAEDPFDIAMGSGKDRFARSDARRELKRGEARWEQSKRELLSLAGERHWEGKGGQPIDRLGSDVTESIAERGTFESEPAAVTPVTPLDLGQVGLGEDEETLKAIDALARPSRQELKSVFEPDVGSDQEMEGEVQQRDDTALIDSRRTDLMHTTSSIPPAKQEQDQAPPGAVTADVALIKPTFVPRSKRTTAVDSPTVETEGKKRKKKKEQKKAVGALTFSFDDDDKVDDAQLQGGVGNFAKKMKTGVSSAAPQEKASKADVGFAEGTRNTVEPSATRAGPEEKSSQPSPRSAVQSSGPSSRIRAADLF